MAEAVDLCARHDIPAIGLWREHVARAGLVAAVGAGALVSGGLVPGSRDIGAGCHDRRLVGDRFPQVF